VAIYLSRMDSTFVVAISSQEGRNCGVLIHRNAQFAANHHLHTLMGILFGFIE
jgi:hypothetical protein